MRSVEQRIGAGTEGPKRQKGGCLAPEAGNDAGLEQRRFFGTGRAKDDERPEVTLGTDLSQFFERVRDLPAAAIDSTR